MDEKAMSRRVRKKKETRIAIIKSAKELFREKGFDNTSVEEITEKADVSRGTFFNYFTNKESILYGLIELDIEDLRNSTEGDLKNLSDPVEKIKVVLTKLADSLIQHFNFTGRLPITAIPVNNEKVSPFQHIYSYLEELVVEGKKKREISDDYKSEEVVAALIGGCYSLVLKELEAKKHEKTEYESDGLLGIIFRGLE